jgi:hypothetical protein
MAGAFNRASLTTLVVGRGGLPGHIVVLTNDSRIDAMLAQGRVSLADTLEKRGPIAINNVLRGPNDGSGPLVPAPTIKDFDPRVVIIAMPAEGSDPAVSPAQFKEWKGWRVAFEVVLEAKPFKLTGVVLMLPSHDPFLLPEQGEGVFVPVFSPVVQIGEITLPDVRPDAILLNRSHLKRVVSVVRL